MKVSKQVGNKLINILNSLKMKKETTQTATVVSSFKSFSAKKIGTNIIVMGEKEDGTSEKLSRKVTKEEGDVIIKKITLFNKKPSDKVGKDIIKLVTPDAVKNKEEKEATETKVKALTKQVKKASKTDKSVEGVKERKSILEELEELLSTDTTAVDKLQALLNKYKKVEEKVAPKATASTSIRTGEY